MSNYETMKDRMSSHFLEYDQEKMVRKFALEHDEKYLYIFFVGRKYRINRITGGMGEKGNRLCITGENGYEGRFFERKV